MLHLLSLSQQPYENSILSPILQMINQRFREVSAGAERLTTSMGWPDSTAYTLTAF